MFFSGQVCCLNQELNITVLSVQNDTQLFIGDDFTVTCLVNKTVKGCDDGTDCRSVRLFVFERLPLTHKRKGERRFPLK